MEDEIEGIEGGSEEERKEVEIEGKEAWWRVRGGVVVGSGGEASETKKKDDGG